MGSHKKQALRPSPPKSEQQWTFRTTSLFLALFLALLAFHLIGNVWWLKHDNLPQVNDPGVHLGFAKTFYRTFTDPDQPNVLKRFAAGRKISTGIYTPLLQVAGAVTAMIFGESKAGYCFANTVVFLGLIIAAYFFARSLFDRWMALYAAFVVSLVPFLYGMSRLFLTNMFSAFFVVCAYCALVGSAGFQRRLWVIGLAIITGLGFWARWTTPLYYALTVCLVFGRGLGETYDTDRGVFDRSKLARVIANGLLFVLVSAVIILPWFLFRAPNLAEVYVRDFAATMSRLAPFKPYTWFTYPIMINNQGAFFAMSLLGIFGLGMALRRMRGNVPLCLLIVWFLGSWAMLMAIWSWRNPSPRYVVPLLPSIALLSVYALSRITQRRLRRVAMALFGGVLLFQYGNITFASYGPIARLELPSPIQHRWFARTGDSGIVVYKDKVDALPAKYGPPFQGENWIDRALKSIASAEIDRHFIRWPQANILLLGARKEAIETVQMDYWPMPTPLAGGRRERTIVGSYVPMSQKAPRPAITASVRTAGRERPVSLSPVFGQTGRLAFDTPCRLSIRCEDVMELSAISMRFPDSNVAFSHYSIRYYDAHHGELAEFSPPVEGTGLSIHYHFYAFEPVEASEIQIEVRRAPGKSDMVTLENIELYQFVPQPRPFILSGVSLSPEAIDWSDLDTKDYIIIAEKVRSPYWASRLSGEFDVLDRFKAGMLGHWEERHFTVMARKERPVITFETTPALRVKVSNDRYPDGRWDLPWWRSNHTTAVQNPAHMDYWASRVPSVAEVSLGGLYEIDGIEIVPYSEEKGVQEARVEFWDETGDLWKTLSPDLWRIDMPKHKTGENRWVPKTLPKPWGKTIFTSRLRFAMLQGGPASENLAYAYVSNIFIYGRKAGEAPSTRALAKVIRRNTSE